MVYAKTRNQLKSGLIVTELDRNLESSPRPQILTVSDKRVFARQKRKLADVVTEEIRAGSSSIESEPTVDAGIRLNISQDGRFGGILRPNHRQVGVVGSDLMAVGGRKGKNRVFELVDGAKGNEPLATRMSSGVWPKEPDDFSDGKKGKKKTLGDRVWKPGKEKHNITANSECVNSTSLGFQKVKRKRRRLLFGIELVDSSVLSTAGPVTRRMARSDVDGEKQLPDHLLNESVDTQVKSMASHSKCMNDASLAVPLPNDSEGTQVKSMAPRITLAEAKSVAPRITRGMAPRISRAMIDSSLSNRSLNESEGTQVKSRAPRITKGTKAEGPVSDPIEKGYITKAGLHPDPPQDHPSLQTDEPEIAVVQPAIMKLRSQRELGTIDDVFSELPLKRLKKKQNHEGDIPVDYAGLGADVGVIIPSVTQIDIDSCNQVRPFQKERSCNTSKSSEGLLGKEEDQCESNCGMQLPVLSNVIGKEQPGHRILLQDIQENCGAPVTEDKIVEPSMLAFRKRNGVGNSVKFSLMKTSHSLSNDHADSHHQPLKTSHDAKGQHFETVTLDKRTNENEQGDFQLTVEGADFPTDRRILRSATGGTHNESVQGSKNSSKSNRNARRIRSSAIEHTGSLNGASVRGPDIAKDSPDGDKGFFYPVSPPHSSAVRLDMESTAQLPEIGRRASDLGESVNCLKGVIQDRGESTSQCKVPTVHKGGGNLAGKPRRKVVGALQLSDSSNGVGAIHAVIENRSSGQVCPSKSTSVPLDLMETLTVDIGKYGETDGRAAQLSDFAMGTFEISHDRGEESSPHVGANSKTAWKESNSNGTLAGKPKKRSMSKPENLKCSSRTMDFEAGIGNSGCQEDTLNILTPLKSCLGPTDPLPAGIAQPGGIAERATVSPKVTEERTMRISQNPDEIESRSVAISSRTRNASKASNETGNSTSQPMKMAPRPLEFSNTKYHSSRVPLSLGQLGKVSGNTYGNMSGDEVEGSPQHPETTRNTRMVLRVSKSRAEVQGKSRKKGIGSHTHRASSRHLDLAKGRSKGHIGALKSQTVALDPGIAAGNVGPEGIGERGATLGNSVNSCSGKSQDQVEGMLQTLGPDNRKRKLIEGSKSSMEIACTSKKGNSVSNSVSQKLTDIIEMDFLKGNLITPSDLTDTGRIVQHGEGGQISNERLQDLGTSQASETDRRTKKMSNSKVGSKKRITVSNLITLDLASTIDSMDVIKACSDCPLDPLNSSSKHTDLALTGSNVQPREVRETPEVLVDTIACTVEASKEQDTGTYRQSETDFKLESEVVPKKKNRLRGKNHGIKPGYRVMTRARDQHTIDDAERRKVGSSIIAGTIYDFRLRALQLKTSPVAVVDDDTRSTGDKDCAFAVKDCGERTEELLDLPNAESQCKRFSSGIACIEVSGKVANSRNSITSEDPSGATADQSDEVEVLYHQETRYGPTQDDEVLLVTQPAFVGVESDSVVNVIELDSPHIAVSDVKTVRADEGDLKGEGSLGVDNIGSEHSTVSSKILGGTELTRNLGCDPEESMKGKDHCGTSDNNDNRSAKSCLLVNSMDDLSMNAMSSTLQPVQNYEEPDCLFSTLASVKKDNVVDEDFSDPLVQVPSGDREPDGSASGGIGLKMNLGINDNNASDDPNIANYRKLEIMESCHQQTRQSMMRIATVSTELPDSAQLEESENLEVTAIEPDDCLKLPQVLDFSTPTDRPECIPTKLGSSTPLKVSFSSIKFGNSLVPVAEDDSTENTAMFLGTKFVIKDSGLSGEGSASLAEGNDSSHKSLTSPTTVTTVMEKVNGKPISAAREDVRFNDDYCRRRESAVVQPLSLGMGSLELLLQKVEEAGLAVQNSRTLKDSIVQSPSNDGDHRRDLRQREDCSVNVIKGTGSDTVPVKRNLKTFQVISCTQLLQSLDKDVEKVMKPSPFKTVSTYGKKAAICGYEFSSEVMVNSEMLQKHGENEHVGDVQWKQITVGPTEVLLGNNGKSPVPIVDDLKEGVPNCLIVKSTQQPTELIVSKSKLADVHAQDVEERSKKEITIGPAELMHCVNEPLGQLVDEQPPDVEASAKGKAVCGPVEVMVSKCDLQGLVSCNLVEGVQNALDSEPLISEKLPEGISPSVGRALTFNSLSGKGRPKMVTICDTLQRQINDEDLKDVEDSLKLDIVHPYQQNVLGSLANSNCQQGPMSQDMLLTPCAEGQVHCEAASGDLNKTRELKCRAASHIEHDSLTNGPAGAVHCLSGELSFENEHANTRCSTKVIADYSEEEAESVPELCAEVPSGVESEPFSTSGASEQCAFDTTKSDVPHVESPSAKTLELEFERKEDELTEAHKDIPDEIPGVEMEKKIQDLQRTVELQGLQNGQMFVSNLMPTCSPQRQGHEFGELNMVAVEDSHCEDDLLKPEQTSDYQTRKEENFKSTSVEGNVSDAIKASGPIKKRKGRLGIEVAKEADVQFAKKILDGPDGLDKHDDVPTRVYSKKKRFPLVSPSVESGGMRIRPRPLDPNQAIPVFLEGRDKEYCEYDGGSLFRWVQQQEEARATKLAPDQVDGVTEVGEPSSSNLFLHKRRPIFIPLFRKLPDDQQSEAPVQKAHRDLLRPSTCSGSQSYLRYMEVPARKRGHALGGSFASVPSVYDMDDEDEEWLQLYNAEISGSCSSQRLSDDTFEQLIEVFEKEFLRTERKRYKSLLGLQGVQGGIDEAFGLGSKKFGIEQTEERGSKKSRIKDTSTFSKPSYIVEDPPLGKEAERRFLKFSKNMAPECCICNGGENSSLNQVYKCQLCSINVHQSCYGICETGDADFSHAPPRSWCCRKCESVKAGRAFFNISCAICCKSGGAMKQTVDPSKWAHVACALYTNETFFVDPEAMEPIDGLLAVDIRVKKLRERCGLCGAREGSCVRCSTRGCRAPFHISCGVSQGASFELRHAKQLVVGVRSFCPRHAGVFPVVTLDEDQQTPIVEWTDPAEPLPAVSSESSESLETERSVERELEREGKIADALEDGARQLPQGTHLNQDGRECQRNSHINPLTTQSDTESDIHGLRVTFRCPPINVEDRLGAISVATSGSSVDLDPKEKLRNEGRRPMEDTCSPVPESTVTEGVELTSTIIPESTSLPLPELETLETSLAPPPVVNAVYAYWQSKRCKAKGPILPELKQRQVVWKQGIFNKVLQKNNMFGPILAQELAGRINTGSAGSAGRRGPRSSTRDPVLSKILELRQQLEILRTVAGNVVRREQLKRDDQELLYESAQLRLLLAREKPNVRHCYWCENTLSLLCCSTCSKAFCFRCFKHRRGYGVKGWIAATKLQKYFCNFCSESLNLETRSGLDNLLGLPSEPQAASLSGVDLSLCRSGFEDSSISNLVQVSTEEPHLNLGRADCEAYCTKSALVRTNDKSRAVNIAYNGATYLSSLTDGNSKLDEVQLSEQHEDVEKKLKKRRIKLKQQVKIKPASVPRTTTRIKKLARSSSFVYGSEDETAVSGRNKVRLEKKSVKLSKLRHTGALDQCTNSMQLPDEEAAKKSLHPLKVNIKFSSGIGKLVIRRHGNQSGGQHTWSLH